MVSMQNGDLLAVAAWPSALVYDRPGGLVIGFIMPEVADAKPIHHLFTSSDLRKREFPQADYRFLVDVSIQLAQTVALIHRAGHVIGDLNESNFLVTQDGKVVAIDCDSFQVLDGSTTHLCAVAKPEYQPPELHARPGGWGDVVRTTNHDHFSLAVIIFKLLFLGVHPLLNSRYLRSPVVTQQTESQWEHILKYHFFYGFDAATKRIAPPGPPLAVRPLPATIVPDSMIKRFERAFLETGALGLNRPSAEEWLNALQSFRQSLRVCRDNRKHFHLANHSPCPFCEHELKTGFSYFAKSVHKLPVIAKWPSVTKQAARLSIFHVLIFASVLFVISVIAGVGLFSGEHAESQPPEVIASMEEPEDQVSEPALSEETLSEETVFEQTLPEASVYEEEVSEEQMPQEQASDLEETTGELPVAEPSVEEPVLEEPAVEEPPLVESSSDEVPSEIDLTGLDGMTEGDWFYYALPDGIYRARTDGSDNSRLWDETGVIQYVEGNRVDVAGEKGDYYFFIN